MPTIDPRDTDTPRSLAALADYAAMGPGRSLEKLVQMWAGTGPTKWLSTLKRWSADGAWSERAARYDAAIQAEEDAEHQAIRRARRAELEEMDWQQGGLLRRQIAEMIAELPKFMRRTESKVEQGGEVVKIITVALNASLSDLSRSMKLASEIQRLSVGEPTEIHKLVESELKAFLDLLESQLSPDEYARIVALAAGAATPGG